MVLLSKGVFISRSKCVRGRFGIQPVSIWHFLSVCCGCAIRFACVAYRSRAVYYLSKKHVISSCLRCPFRAQRGQRRTTESLSEDHGKSLLIGKVLNTISPNCPNNFYFLFRGLYFSFKSAINLPGKGKAGPKEHIGDPSVKT